MANGPLYIPRSYGGGAVVAQLQAPIEAGDLSFALSTTLGWTDLNGNPLGTTGPFTVVIDRFTPTVEKIACSSVNLTTGVVEVATGSDYTGNSGRGFDDSTAQAHVPNGSTSGVQTCWSSVEAFEANAAVTYILGTAGGTPGNGDVLGWSSGAPLWGPNTPLAGVSAARMYNTGGGVIADGTPTHITTISDFTNGTAITYSTNEFTVSTTGKYLVTWSIGYNSGGGSVGSGYYDAMVYQNGSVVRQTSAGSVSGGQPVIGGSDLIAATAADVFQLWGQQGSGGTEGITAGSIFTYLSMQLVSTP